jgi:FkbM family methyltransferase
VADWKARQMKLLSGFAPDGWVSPDIIPLDYPDAALHLYITSKVERRSRAISCAKEPWTVEWLRRDVGAGDVFYDVGANVGAYALVAATRVAPGGTVVAFEPGYASYAHLCDNIVLNGFGDVIVPVALPLSARSELGRFEYYKLQPGFARHGVEGPRGDEADVRDKVFRQRAPMIRLDDAVALFQLPAVTHLKLDVDGWEPQVLEGAAATLRNPALRSILLEVEVVNTQAVTGLLTAAGFALVERFQRSVDGIPVGWWTGLFRRE